MFREWVGVDICAIHPNVSQVMHRRGSLLKEEDTPDALSGAMFNGVRKRSNCSHGFASNPYSQVQAVEMGLADQIYTGTMEVIYMPTISTICCLNI